MPNIKSAKKRVKVTASNHEENVHVKGAMKTAYKNAIKEPTLENVKIANKRIDKAVNKGIIKANTEKAEEAGRCISSGRKES